MRWLSALLLVAACNEPSSEGYPINPGGGGGIGSSVQIDAPASGADAGLVINGRVCLLVDPRAVTACETTGAGNLTVTLGSSTTTTADDGAFTLTRPASTAGLHWLVTGGAIETSAIEFGATTTLPAIDMLLYADMLAATNAVVVTGQGAIIARVTRASAAVTGATVVAQPAPDSEIYYDGADALAWETDGTGAHGVAWLPSIAVGTAQLTIDETAKQTVIAGVAVFGDTITFVFAALP